MPVAPTLPKLAPKDMQWVRWVNAQLTTLNTNHTLLRNNINATISQNNSAQTATANVVQTQGSVLTIDVPTGLPQTPTSPILTSDRGTVTITWDGSVYSTLSTSSDYGNAVLPAQGFNRVDLYRAAAANGPYTLINYITNGSTSVVDTQVSVGTTYWYAFVTTDNLGVSSKQGPSSSITVAGIGLGSLAQDLKDANAAVANTATSALSIANQSAATAGAAFDYAGTAQTTANNAQSDANSAQVSADNAKSAANVANDAALSAVGIANNKGKVWFQSTAPIGNSNDLWIDTTNNANTPKRWDGANWLSVTDKAATDAATIAVNANAAAQAAQTAAANAQATADAARTAAQNAQTSADGKNRIVYSTVDASSSSPGTTVGDIWYKYSGQFLTGMWRWDGSNWQNQQLTNTVIATLDAGKITSGTIDTARIGAKSITAQQLAITGFDPNQIANGTFENGLTGWTVGEGNGAASISTDQYYDGSKSLSLYRNTSSSANIQLWQTQDVWTPVNAGEGWLFTAYAKANNPTINGFYLRAFFYTSTDNTNYVSYQDAVSNASTTTQWTKYSGSFIVPANATRMRYSIYNAASGTTIFVDQIQAVKQNSGELIVDGTITANKIQAGAITTEKLGANVVTANKIAAGAIDTNALSAGSVTTNKLNATAIDGMTITGAVFRTSGNAGQNGVIIDSSGVRGYKNNAQSFYVDSNGDVSVTGYINATGGNFTGYLNAQSGFISGNLTVQGSLITGNGNGLINFDANSLRIESRNNNRTLYLGTTQTLGGSSYYTTAVRWSVYNSYDDNNFIGYINGANDSSRGYGLDIKSKSLTAITGGAGDLNIASDDNGGQVYSNSIRARLYASSNRTDSSGNRILVITPYGTLGSLTGVISSNYTSSSSRRFKHDIEDWRPDVAKVLSLNPVRFKYNDGDGSWRVGMIAEQMEDAGFPELVARNDNGDIQTIEYLYFGAALLHVAREQQKTINNLEQRLQEAGI